MARHAVLNLTSIASSKYVSLPGQLALLLSLGFGAQATGSIDHDLSLVDPSLCKGSTVYPITPIRLSQYRLGLKVLLQDGKEVTAIAPVFGSYTAIRDKITALYGPLQKSIWGGDLQFKTHSQTKSLQLVQASLNQTYGEFLGNPNQAKAWKGLLPNLGSVETALQGLMLDQALVLSQSIQKLGVHSPHVSIHQMFPKFKSTHFKIQDLLRGIQAASGEKIAVRTPLRQMKSLILLNEWNVGHLRSYENLMTEIQQKLSRFFDAQNSPSQIEIWWISS